MNPQNVVGLTVRRAASDKYCRQTFAAQIKKSEHRAFELGLKAIHIRSLLYLKTLKETETSVQSMAQDLDLSRLEVFDALQQLRTKGFL